MYFHGLLQRLLLSLAASCMFAQFSSLVRKWCFCQHTLCPNLALARSSQAWLCSRGELGDCMHIVFRCHMPVFQPPHSFGEFRILAKGVWAGRIIKLEYCFRAGPHARSCFNPQVCSSRRAQVNCARGQAAAHLVLRIFEEGIDGQMVHHSTGFFNEGCQCYSGSEDSTSNDDATIFSAFWPVGGIPPVEAAACMCKLQVDPAQCAGCQSDLVHVPWFAGQPPQRSSRDPKLISCSRHQHV